MRVDASITWLLSLRYPVQRRTDDYHAYSAIQDAVTHQMDLAFVGDWAKQAKRLAPEDAGHSNRGNQAFSLGSEPKRSTWPSGSPIFISSAHA